MVADVVRFYKWLFLDFGLQNYSIGNKDVLPFFSCSYQRETQSILLNLTQKRKHTMPFLQK